MRVCYYGVSHRQYEYLQGLATDKLELYFF